MSSNFDLEAFANRINERFTEALAKIEAVRFQVETLKREVEDLKRRLPEEPHERE